MHQFDSAGGTHGFLDVATQQFRGGERQHGTNSLPAGQYGVLHRVIDEAAAGARMFRQEVLKGAVDHPNGKPGRFALHPLVICTRE